MDITAWALVIDGVVVSVELQEPKWANMRGKWVKVEIKMPKENI